MYPQINGKQLIDCGYEDLKELIHNPDYRENQYLDYKATFSFLGEGKNANTEKIAEFRNDVCSFANADGGYIIYGIGDDQGTASKLIGLEIDNPDRFELNLRNRLSPIMPKMPPIKISFVKMDNDEGDGRYIVIVFIEHDYYAPYIHLENEKNYKIYKRYGNQKAVVGYSELKNMFIQSRTLEDEILRFRKKRIEYYKSVGFDERFMLLHIIPENFLSERKQLFLIERKKKQSFGLLFAETGIDSFSIPCVDGLRYVATYRDVEALLYNNGIAEFLLPLKTYVGTSQEGLYFYNEDVWESIDNVAQGYQKIIPDLFGNQRYFACISIIGCKDIISECDRFGRFATHIDRDEIICQPVAFIDLEDKDSFYLDLKKLQVEYLLSLGIKRDEKITELLEEI